MSNGRQRVSGVSSRRSACDRCRFSKARCLRKVPSQTRCDRCVRTNNLDCVTSPIFRLRSWQPPVGSEPCLVRERWSGREEPTTRQCLTTAPSHANRVRSEHPTTARVFSHTNRIRCSSESHILRNKPWPWRALDRIDPEGWITPSQFGA